VTKQLKISHPKIGRIRNAMERRGTLFSVEKRVDRLPEFPRLLAEIAVAENAAEIDAIAKRAAKTIASLPPRERERANERITDIIAEKPE
jgi:hypothetical protein